jgi:osmotically-inducible protein OsmY
MLGQPGNVRCDDNIADRALQALWQDPFLDPQGLDLVVNAGVVTLVGVDVAPASVARAYEILDAVAGVQGVLNGTTVTLQLAA